MVINSERIKNPLASGQRFTVYEVSPTGGARYEILPGDVVVKPTKGDTFGKCYLGDYQQCNSSGPSNDEESRDHELKVNLVTTLLIPGWDHPDIDVDRGASDGTIVFKATPEEVARVLKANTNPHFASYSEIFALTTVSVFPDGRPTVSLTIPEDDSME